VIKPTLHLAVRSLVERVLRSGDLRLDYFGAVRAAEGIRIHRQIQSRRPDGYQAEVPVRFSTATEKIEYVISGRIDGLFARDPLTVIEEIKSTRHPLEDLVQDHDPVHWGQAQCYAYMWACQESLPRIAVQLTYVRTPGGEHRELTRVFDTSELKVFFDDLLRRYEYWFADQIGWDALRDLSIAGLEFPFETYRTGQRAMAVAVFRAVRDGGQLLVQAATGIGKTMAALYPAIKAQAESEKLKIIYLTARTTGRLAAEAALDVLRARGLRIKSVSLTAKDKICLSPQSACLPEECPFALGFFDRINDALRDALRSDAFTRAAIEEVARRHRVCPFELSLELTQWADIVIGDYNYVFDPGVALRRLLMEENTRNALLVDEAHNLPDRARDMFSAGLCKSAVLALRRTLKKELPQLYRILGRINRWMVAARRQCRDAGGTLSGSARPDELLELLQLFGYTAERWLARNIRTVFREELLAFYFDSLSFLRAAESYDDCYHTIFEETAEDWTVQLFCIDPAPQVREVWRQCGPAVLFSATLTPAEYFQTTLGCVAEAGKLNVPSPFPAANLAVIAELRIQTLFRRREASCAAVSRAIAAVVNRRKGNYLLFFPSYAYLQMVYGQFGRDYPHIRTIVQRSEMNEADRDTFLCAFEDAVSQTLVGFAVMGGVFGEGIDLMGERLTGAVIVGVGLPGICVRRDLIRAYFDRRGGCGFEFAYQYPGLNRVLQAAGRVIRSEQDRGVVLLIDQRYAQQRYRTLLPSHWHVQVAGAALESDNIVDRFWNECP
jgi:DNA excision repair protein ERCC-2